MQVNRFLHKLINYNKNNQLQVTTQIGHDLHKCAANFAISKLPQTNGKALYWTNNFVMKRVLWGRLDLIVSSSEWNKFVFHRQIWNLILLHSYFGMHQKISKSAVRWTINLFQSCGTSEVDQFDKSFQQLWNIRSTWWFAEWRLGDNGLLRRASRNSAYARFVNPGPKNENR